MGIYVNAHASIQNICKTFAASNGALNVVDFDSPATDGGELPSGTCVGQQGFSLDIFNDALEVGMCQTMLGITTTPEDTALINLRDLTDKLLTYILDTLTFNVYDVNDINSVLGLLNVVPETVQVLPLGRNITSRPVVFIACAFSVHQYA